MEEGGYEIFSLGMDDVTGQGIQNAVMQHLDARLLTQINDGNCVSPAVNQGYGWAGNVNRTLRSASAGIRPVAARRSGRNRNE